MIVLINYPYKDWKVGEKTDLGKVKNESMIAMGRALAIDDIPEPVKTIPIFEDAEEELVIPPKKNKKKSIQKKKNGNNNNRSC